MSNKFRNPFKLRASERIESEVGFLRLFSPLVLEALVEKHQSGELWENVLLIHSSPGGGKTSLLRAFEPSSLNTLLNNKTSNEYRLLFNTLKKIEVIDDQVQVLGVTLPCTRNYQILEELDISDAQKTRLFFSLLNSRVVLATLRSACKLKSKKFPNELSEFQFIYDNNDNYFRSLNVPCNGKQLFDWASDVERKIYKLIDSFLPIKDLDIEGHDELLSLLVLKPENLLLNGKEICNKVLFMFDDAHKLSSSQRISLKKYIIEKRGGFNVWISERLEALNTNDQIGSFKERDFDIINLENFWQRYPKKLEKILSNISDKRAAYSTEEVTSFQEYLNDNLNEEEIKNKLLNIISETETKLYEISQFSNKFDDWLSFANNLDDTLLKKALLLKEIEILIHRNLGKPQLSFEFPLTVDEFYEKKSSDVANAAQLFLSMNNEIPYYFGFQTLTKLSSFNIEQFLSFSAEMFEEMISNKIKGNDIQLTDKIQNEIILKVVKKKWKKLNTEIPYSKNVQNFLISFGEFSKNQTFKPNAPYSPGVNGFAIRQKTENKLYKDEFWIDDPVYEQLINVISTCVAFNLLEKHPTNQGKKGQSWVVYYMNRWLCVLFGLPISYGGWRHQSPSQLIKWFKK
jgi:hypothetical protein